MLAQFYLILPLFLTFTLAKGPVDKPTQVSGFKLPGSAILSPLSWAFPYLPAATISFI